MNVRRLPVVLRPGDGESLPSYIARTAVKYQVPLADMLYALGLTSRLTGHPRVTGYGTFLPSEHVCSFCRATGLAEDVVSAMLLTRFDGVTADLSGLDTERPETFLEVTRRQWMLFRGSRLCPECLAESGGAWSLTWKLPWTFSCVRHERLLAERCPACEQLIARGRGDSCLPDYWGRVPEPSRCGNATPTRRGDRAKREPCGHDLTAIGRADLTGYPPLLTAQATIDRVIEQRRATVAGQPCSSVEYFAHARSLYALLLHHARPDDYRDLPPVVAAALARRLDERDRLRRTHTAGGRQRHLVMYRRNLTDVGITAALAPTVTSLLGAASDEEVSARLQVTARRIYARHGGRIGLQRYYGVSPRLEAALLAAMPRRRSSLWVKSELVRERAILDLDDVARAVPPVLWRDVWEGTFSRLIPTNRPWAARRFLSMQMVKLQTQCSWEAASRSLGYSNLGPGVAVGYVNRASRDGTADALRGEAERLVAQLRGPYELSPGEDQAHALVDYRRRRELLADLAHIDEHAWQGVISASGLRDTGARRYCAAIWLWCELTGGHIDDAPGWRGTPVRAPEMYQRFVTHALPRLKGPLVEYGRALLRDVGDTRPDRAELLLA